MKSHLAAVPPAVAALLLIGLSLMLPGSGEAQGSLQPYAGQQTRMVSSLSDQDVAEYLEGRGAGLALPAELNGYPGPLHVLQLAKDLQLTADQRRRAEDAFNTMNRAARAAGARYISAEKALDEAFKTGTATPQSVAELARAAAALRAEVQLAHLNAHLQITPLLTADQRRAYANLRGYAGGEGHDRHDRDGHKRSH